MTDLKKNIPKLRFPEFSEEWEEKRLGDFLIESMIKGNKGNEAKKLTVKLWGKGIVPKNEAHQGSGNTQYYIRKNGQLMYGKLDFLNCAFGIVPPYLDGYESTIDSPAFDFIKGEPIFILERIKQKSFYKKYGEKANGSRKAKRINQKDFLKMKLSFPILKEQQKIGDFFSKLDRQIELEEQKLALLEEQKKGYMQKIFSQELRFKDDNGNDYPEWEEKKLSDLGSYSKSYSFSRDVEGEGKVHHIHYGDIHSKLPSKISDINLLPTIKESKDFEFLQKGDIIFADASEDYKDLGKAIMVDIDEDNIIAGLHTHVFRPNLQIVSEFLMYYTKTLNYFKFIKRQGTGISVLGISKKNLSNFVLGLPERREQQKIGDFFSKLDQQIELQGQKIESLKQRKKGLLQKMFV
ncbi:restriction endonuclease subunit S [Staphylococcus delphini]|uniref:restriction endonuclease subunit S n=1 Tax=Staphylococcus delphini TaxID=53344 RepID=UPI0023B28415|nr:restriction endonuclease subunit S [Staphylococcus delphini]MDE9800488.1 restriction endonuclease subunit S [Staphylococcus delphini]MDE9806910.1 restriction endonuclease subunit S [Staphylococcus delphini]